jgi:HK97 family phage major capsid protein
MTTIREILSRREAIRSEMRAIHAAHPDALPDAQQKRWNELEAQAANLNALEARQAMMDDLDRRSSGQHVAGSGDSSFDALSAQVSIMDTIRAQMGATDAGAGRAREVSAELARRSGRNPDGLFAPMGVSAAERRTLNLSTGAGSNLVQTTVASSVIDVLRAKSVVMKAGATVISGLVGNLALPRLASSASVGWFTDGATIGSGNPTLEQQTFSPHHVGGIVSVSRQLVQQSSPDVARVVENDLAALIATGIDTAALNGSGSSGQPTGILNTSGLTIVAGGTNGLAASWANIQALVGAVDTANALDGSLAFVTNAKVCKSLRSTLKTTADASSNFIMVNPGQLAGYPLFSTQNMPSNITKGTGTNLSAMLFGDFSSVYIAAWSMLDILVSPYSTSFTNGGLDIRAAATVDIGTRHIAAFAATTDIIAP